MKKTATLIFAAICFLFNGTANAQFNEDFESGLPGNFTESINQGTTGWGDCAGSLSSQTCPIGGASSATFYVGNYNGDNATLTTPTMDLSAGGYRLAFVHSQLDWGGDQNELLVEISTDDGVSWATIENFTTSISAPASEMYLLDTYTTTATTKSGRSVKHLHK